MGHNNNTSPGACCTIFVTMLDTEKRLSLLKYFKVLIHTQKIDAEMSLFISMLPKTFGIYTCWLYPTQWLPSLARPSLSVQGVCNIKFLFSCEKFLFMLGFLFFSFLFAVVVLVRERLVALAANVLYQGGPLLLLSTLLTPLGRESAQVSGPHPPPHQISLRGQSWRLSMGPACHSRSLPNGPPQRNPEI